MGDGFKKFKRKAFCFCVFKSSLLGLSVGMGTFALLTALLKWRILLIGSIGALLCSLAVGVAAALIWFAVSRPRTMKLAKQLDSSLNLDEKVQTMVTFEQETSDMFALQRMDADKRLRETATGRFRIRRLWGYALSFILTAGLLCLSVFALPEIPEDPDDSDEDPGRSEETDVPFTLSDWQRTRLQNLIRMVETSELETETRAQVVVDLKTLAETLEHVETQAEMKQLVIDVIVRTSDRADGLNTYRELVRVLKTSENETVLLFATALSVGDIESFRTRLNALEDSFDAIAEGNLHPTDNEETLPLTVITDFAKELAVKLDSESFEDSDIVRLSLSDFAARLSAISEEHVTTAKGIVTTAFSELGADTLRANGLRQQYINQTVCDTVVSELMNIFGISRNELPISDGSEDDVLEDKKDETQRGDDGGLGDGQFKYGGDDEIYDFDSDAYVIYGDVIDVRYAVVFQQLQSGQLSDEMRKYIENYFSALYGSIQTDGSDNSSDQDGVNNDENNNEEE